VILAGQRIRALDFAGTAYDQESAVDTTTSTSYVNGTLHGVAFVAPTSGSVWIEWGGMLGSNTTTITSPPYVYLSIYVRTGSTVASGTDVLISDDTNAILFYKHDTNAVFLYDAGARAYKLEGLTAGSSYNVITQFRATAATAAVNDRWVKVSPAFE
jgi:hypothetical protein